MIDENYLNDPLQFDDTSDRSKKPKYLYHYTKRQTGIEKILTYQSLRFNSLRNTHDPLEYNDLIHVIEFDKSFLEKDSYFQKTRSIEKIIKDDIKVACFSTDSPFEKFHNDSLLNKGFTMPRMWAQYGEGQYGMCFIFDREFS